MASEKITQMPTAVALGGTELIPMVQSGGNVKATVNQVLTLGWNAGSVAAVAGGLALNQGTVVVAENSAGIFVGNTTTATITGSIVVGNSITGMNFTMAGGAAGGGGVANAAAAASSASIGMFMSGWVHVTAGETITYSLGSFGLGGAAGNNNGTLGGDTSIVGSFGTITAKAGVAGVGSASGNAAAASVGTQTAMKPVTSSTLVLKAFSMIGGANGSAGQGGSTNNANQIWSISGTGGTAGAGGNGQGWGAPGGGASSTSNGAFAGGNGTGGALWLTPAN